MHTVFLSAQGQPFNQQKARELLAKEHFILVCGHYEGIDQRFIDECVDEEISIGDFVLTGGEIPAMAVADAVCRMVPGVLPDEEAFTAESHWDGLLEHPQYTRPENWRGREVPVAGLGHFIHTYQCDGDPLPPFRGEPKCIRIELPIREFTNLLWNSLNEQNKVSLFVRYVDLETGEVEQEIRNKNAE